MVDDDLSVVMWLFTRPGAPYSCLIWGTSPTPVCLKELGLEAPLDSFVHLRLGPWENRHKNNIRVCLKMLAKPRTTQWFCWSLSLWKNGYFIGNIDPTFSGPNPHDLAIQRSDAATQVVFFIGSDGDFFRAGLEFWVGWKPWRSLNWLAWSAGVNKTSKLELAYFSHFESESCCCLEVSGNNDVWKWIYRHALVWVFRRRPLQTCSFWLCRRSLPVGRFPWFVWEMMFQFSKILAGSSFILRSGRFRVLHHW